MRRRLPLAAAACVAFAAFGAIALAARPKSEPVVRDALAKSDHPRGAPGRTLGLSRVVIRPGAKLALHHHPGTQIARIEHGTLTYTVHSGRVRVRRGDADSGGHLVRTIKAGQTARLRPGQWIVEQPSDHHSAANRGRHKVVIYLSSLFRTGAPLSIPG